MHLCEYGAQAMAVHGGLVAQREASVAAPGLLVPLRDVALHCDFVDDLAGELMSGRRLQASDAAWQYDFRVDARRRLLAQGRAVCRPPRGLIFAVAPANSVSNGPVMNVVRIAITISMVNRSRPMTPASRPTFITISSISARAFISDPTASAVRHG